jgi:long-chain acyl-CoA synthetase
MPLFELKIVDDSGRSLQSGQAGEIMVKGPVMKGYYANPAATATVISGNWLHTGDIGWLDKDKELHITGLKKPMLISKGQNIYFSDIEDVLTTHPCIAEVSVMGTDDPERMRGQVVRTVIKLKKGRNVTGTEIRKYCLERIANYKTPKQVIFTDSLVKTSGGSMDNASTTD